MQFFHPSRNNASSMRAIAGLLEPARTTPDEISEASVRCRDRLLLKVFTAASRMDCAAMVITRIGLVVVLIWIGGLKAFDYEAEAIVPFVANSPLTSFFYKYPATEYKHHMNAPGELVSENQEWHEANHTYDVSYALGIIIVAFGVLIAMHPWFPGGAALGSFLVFLMSLIILSFLITTPEAWVPALGSPYYGFPLLTTPGLLVLKDAIMMGAALVTMADSAKVYLRRAYEFPRRVRTR